LQYAQVLHGWREIAAYLRRSYATVRRYHEERRMPIAFLGPTVVIPRAALDLWILGGRQTQKRREKVSDGRAA
jgi:excisionase family DNA binding protein